MRKIKLERLLKPEIVIESITDNINPNKREERGIGSNLPVRKWLLKDKDGD